MTVKELIGELKKCNPDDIVMYDRTNALKNLDGWGDELHVGVENVRIGTGILSEFVYLEEIDG